MASWFYAYNGEQRGPVDDDELKMLEQQGVVKASTLVWREGMADWLTLAEVQGRPRPSTTAAPMLSSAPAPAPTSAPYDPSPYAAPSSPYADPAGYSSLTVDEEPEGPAWENVYTPTHVRAWETVKACLLRPNEFFETMRREGDFAQPLYFAALMTFVGTLASAVWQVPMQLVLAAVGVSASGGDSGGAAFGAAAGEAVMGACCAAIIAPVAAVIGTFVSAAIYHVLLMMLGGANRSYETSFRVVAYANGATALLNIVPCYIGSLIAPFWALFLLCVGLAKAHGTDTWKGAAAVLIPFVLCCGAIVVLMVVFWAAIAAAMTQAGGGGF